MNKIKVTLTFLFIAFCARSSFAGTTAFDFLKIGVGTRQMGMGNNGVVSHGDANSMAYNPATGSDITQQEVGFLYTRWLEGISYQYASYVYPHANIGTFGLSVNYLSYGDIQGYSSANKKTNNISASDMALNLSYAKGFHNGFSYGLNTHYIEENLNVATAKGYSLDMGALYRLQGDAWWSNIDLGMAVKHLGPNVKFIQESAALPLEVDLGMSYAEWKGKYLFNLEMRKIKDQDLKLGVGGEITTKNFLTFRTGYETGKVLSPGVTVGVGIQFWEKSLQIDYAFVPFDNLTNVHRVGFMYRFGGVEQRHFKNGLRLMRQGKYGDAIIEFDKVLQERPNHALATRYMKRCAAELSKEVNP